MDHDEEIKTIYDRASFNPQEGIIAALIYIAMCIREMHQALLTPQMVLKSQTCNWCAGYARLGSGEKKFVDGHYEGCPEQIKTEEWKEAYIHFEAVRQQYHDIGAVGAPALAVVFAPLLVRYERGERSDELLEAMRSVE